MHCDALHWPLMAWSRRRKLWGLVTGILLGLAPIWLLMNQGQPSELRRSYDRVKIGMTDEEVMVHLAGDGSEIQEMMALAGRELVLTEIHAKRLVYTEKLRDEDVLVPVEVVIDFDDSDHVSGKRYESGILLKAHRWVNDLLQRLHW